MQKQLSTALLVLTFICLSVRNEAAVYPAMYPKTQGNCTSIRSINMPEGVPIVDIVMGYNGNATMSWDSFGDPGPYAVTVRDLTAFNTIASFSTTNTSANISGLTTGHTYRFEVAKAADTIIVDIVVSG